MPEMTTKRLMKLAAQHDEAHQAEKDAKARKTTLAGKIIPELKRRGIKTITGMGWKVTHVEQKETVYNVAAARELLTAKQFKAITEPRITADLVNAALADGVIKPRHLAKFSKRVPKSSYVLVNPQAEDE
jgi:hypothetical protein